MACAAAMEQAEAEGLTLIVATSRTGYFGVRHELSKHHQHKPYQARVFRGGKQASLGYFTTAEEAALCVARSPQGQLIAKKGQLIAPPHGQLIAPPLTSTEALQQARAEGLTLVVAKCTTGYRGVYINNPGSRRPFQANGSRYGKRVSMGNFATAEEAALCVARSPEGQAAAKRAAASEEGQGNPSAMPSGAVLKEEGAVPPMPLGAFVKEEEVVPPLPPGTFIKEENAPPMPPDAVVKQEHEVVVEERSQDGRGAKRQRST